MCLKIRYPPQFNRMRMMMMMMMKRMMMMCFSCLNGEKWTYPRYAPFSHRPKPRTLLYSSPLPLMPPIDPFVSFGRAMVPWSRLDPNMTPQKVQDRWKGPFEDTWWELLFKRISCIYRVTSCYFYNLSILKKLGRSKSQQVFYLIKCHCFFCVLSCFWALERLPSGAVRHYHVAAKAPVQHCQWLGNTVETWGNWVFWVMNIAILYNVPSGELT